MSIPLPPGYVAVDFGYYEGEVYTSTHAGHFVPEELWATWQAKRNELNEIEEQMQSYPFHEVSNNRLIGH